MDEIELEAIRAEGHDPDDPAVVTAIDLVRWELSLLWAMPTWTTTPGDPYSCSRMTASAWWPLRRVGDRTQANQIGLAEADTALPFPLWEHR